MPVALIGTIAGDLPHGLLDQHPDAARAGARDRARRRRRHRRAREHRPPARPGHGPARGGGARHAAGVLRRDRDHATLVAVFVPISFLPGQTGRAVPRVRLHAGARRSLLSASWRCRSARCSPRACSAHDEAAHAQSGGRSRGRGAGSRLYRRLLRAALDAPLVVVDARRCSLPASALLSSSTRCRQELTPPEDRGHRRSCVSARPQGVSLDYTAGKMRRSRICCSRSGNPARSSRSSPSPGFGGDDNGGFMILTLAPWDERDARPAGRSPTTSAAAAKVVGRAQLHRPAEQPRHPRRRPGAAVRLVGGDYDELATTADDAGRRRWSRTPASASVAARLQTTQPQLFIDVDRERASDLGIDIDGLGETLQAVLDGTRSARSSSTTAAIDVKLRLDHQPGQRPGRPREHVPEDPRRARWCRCRPSSTSRRRRSPQLDREGQMRAVAITAGARRRHGARRRLRRGRRRSRSRCCRRATGVIPLAEPRRSARIRTALARRPSASRILVVFLVLAAQFESFVSAVIVMATVPLGLGCAVVAMVLTGGQPQRLQPDRPGAAGRHHRQERHPDRRVRQPAARPRRQRARGDRGGLPTSGSGR